MEISAKFLNLRWTSLGEGVWHIVICTPLEGECLEVCTAGHCIIRGSPQWCDGKIIQKAFKGSPALMSSMIGFDNPQFCWAICQWVSDFAKLNGVNNFFVRNSSCSSRDVAVRHRICFIAR